VQIGGGNNKRDKMQRTIFREVRWLHELEKASTVLARKKQV
jgi:hypothetical protein